MVEASNSLVNDTQHGNAMGSLGFEKDYKLTRKVRSLNGATWSQSQGYWYTLSIAKGAQGLRYLEIKPGKC